MHFLGIDVGTGGTRALVMDATGAVVASETEDHRPFTSPQIGWAEQAPKIGGAPAVWLYAKRSQRVTCAAEEIACVGLSGQMHGAVLLDEEGARSAACTDLVRRQNRKAEPGT